MTIPKPEISRKQAWCKLIVLVAEGLPAPANIHFFPPGELWNGLDIVVEDASALWRWANRLGAALTDPRWYPTVGAWHQHATGTWHGYDLTVKTYDAAALGESVSDMAAVQAIAADQERA